MKAQVVRVGRLFGLAVLLLIVVEPLVTWLITGTVDSLALIHGVEALIVLAFLWLRRAFGLPAWSADEAYVTRLRRWRAVRR